MYVFMHIYTYLLGETLKFRNGDFGIQVSAFCVLLLAIMMPLKLVHILFCRLLFASGFSVNG